MNDSERVAMSRVLDKAQKLKALAEGGEGGEKTKAKAILLTYLAKHGLTEADLAYYKNSHYHFTYEHNQGALLSMIICHVVCDAMLLSDEKKPNEYFLECTEQEAVKINRMFEFYLEAYRREEDFFLTAFLYKNDLTPNLSAQEVVNAKPKADDRFHVKSAPASVKSVEFNDFQQKKINGLMSWMPKYKMDDK